jgi:heptaprenylglyceryl phosphate synthase
MDSQSPLSASIDYLRYSTVIILPNRVAADEYLDTIYQYHTDCVIFACDGSYPADTTLRQSVESRIAADPKLSIIIFGAEAALSLNIKSQSIFI